MHKVPVDVERNCTIKLLIDNVVLEDLVIEGLRCAFCARHFCFV